MFPSAVLRNVADLAVAANLGGIMRVLIGMMRKHNEQTNEAGANTRRRFTQIAKCSAYTVAAAAITVLTAAPAHALSNYVPPVVTTASTTLYSSSTAFGLNRISVDKAGNVFYMVTGGSTSTLMELAAGASAPVTLITGLGQYNAQATFVDVNGNLWISDGNGTATPSGGSTDYLSLVEIPALNGIPNTGAITAGGVTIGAVDATHCAASTTVPCTWPNYKLNTSGSSISGPQVADLFVDGSGNVYFVDIYDGTNSGNTITPGKVNLLAGGSATVLASGLPHDYNSQIAVDGAGNVFYLDGSTGAVSQVSGGVLTGVGSSASLGSFVQISSATGLSADAWGNLYIVSGTQISEVPFEGTGVNFADEFGIVNGLSSSTTNSVSYGGAPDAYGNYYYLYNASASSKLQKLSINTYNFGSVAVGSLVTGPTLTIFANTSQTMNSYFATGSPTSNTSTALLQSFPYSGTKSFSGGSTLAAGSTGTIIMNFEPVHPGLLKGSYTPRSGSSANEFQSNLTGVGVGPQPMFLPGTATSLFTSAATSSSVSTPVTLNNSQGLAVDTYGDIFLADTGNGKVVADCLATTTATVDGNGSIANSFCGSAGYTGAVVELATGFTKPSAIALDGVNNLYVVDSSANSLTVIQNVNLASSTPIIDTTTIGGTALNGPLGIAIDGYANVYIADSGNNRIVQAHQYGAAATQNAVYVASTVKFGGTALSNPTGIALDSAGDLFIADTGNNRIVKVTPMGVTSVVSTTGVTLNAPSAVQVLPSGALVVTDRGNGLSLITNGTGAVLPVGSFTLSGPQGVALDLAGNIYITDTGNTRVLELAVSTPAATAFLSTPQGGTSASATATVNNSGNAALAISAAPLSSSANFTVNGATTCSATSSLVAGTGSCTVVSNFTPQATGALTGNITLTDNQLGFTLNTSVPSGVSETATFGTSGTQAIALNGTGTASATAAATPTFTPNGGTFSSTQSVTISDTTTGATIYYTTNGSAPTAASTPYTGAISVSATTTIKAIAVATGYDNSAIGSATFTISTLATKVPVVLSQFAWYTGGTLSSGGFLAGGSPLGGSFAVTQQGNIVLGNTYGSQILLYNPTTATMTNISGSGGFSNPGGVTIDSSNNIYISHIYNNLIYKVPYVNGGYAVSDPSGPYPPYCTGTDTVECQYGTTPSGTNARAMTFDATGNFYMVSTPSGTGSTTIWKCSAPCVNPSSTSTQIYADTNTVGSIAADSYGNVFFSDGVFTNLGNEASTSSALNELTFNGTAYASTPIVLATYTDASPGNYDDALGAVGVDSKNTVYYATQYSGMYAFPNNSGVINAAQVYGISPQGGKGMEIDASGNIYIVGYNNGDSLGKITVGNITMPNAGVGTPSTATNVTVMDNATTCSTSPAITLSATEGGSATTEFTGNTTGSCQNQSPGSKNGGVYNTGAYYATSLTFSPTTTGTRTALLTATDTTNVASGTANITGVAAASSQAISFTQPTTPVAYTTTPITLTATATSGLTVTFSIVSGPGTISGNQLTITGVGSIVIAANQAGNAVYSPAPQVTRTVVVSQASQTITFTPLTSPMQYTTTPITLAATASSGLTVTFSVLSGPGTVSGNNLTITGVGTIVVAADQAGSANYLAAPEATQSLVVTQASQTINFPAPTSPVTYSTTPIALSATSSSSLAVTFSVVSGPGTISGTSLTLTNSGTVVIAANQSGNANYSAASQVTHSITVNAAGPAFAPTYSPVAGTYYATQTVTIASATPGAVIYYTTNGSQPTTSSTVYSGPISVSATEVVQAFATAPGYTQSITSSASYTVYTGSANFTLSANPSSLTIPYGGQGAIAITLTPQNGFTGAVTFACSGLPAGASCAFNPSATVTPTNGAVVVAITLTAPASAQMRFPGQPLAPVAAFAMALGLFTLRKRRRLLLLMMAVVTVMGLQMLTGCGTSSPTAKTSSVTITGTSGSLTQTVPVSVTFQ
jgi:sugar lactone lactonase YvrE